MISKPAIIRGRQPMKVWYCRDAFGNQRLLGEPCGGAGYAEGCGWMQLVPADARVVHPEHRNPEWPPPGPDDGLPGSAQARLIVIAYMWDGERWVEHVPIEAAT